MIHGDDIIPFRSISGLYSAQSFLKETKDADLDLIKAALSYRPAIIKFSPSTS